MAYTSGYKRKRSEKKRAFLYHHAQLLSRNLDYIVWRLYIRGQYIILAIRGCFFFFSFFFFFFFFYLFLLLFFFRYRSPGRPESFAYASFFFFFLYTLAHCTILLLFSRILRFGSCCCKLCIQ